MDIYNHFSYGEQLAIRLKSISHTPEKPRFFEAFGLEDLYNLDDKLSSVTGMILIAVNGYESDSRDNGGDGLNDALQYSFIVARNTISDRPQTITSAFEECRPVCKQIRNVLFQDPQLSYAIDRNTQINGIGPIGDNFYGCMLTFTIHEAEDFLLTQPSGMHSYGILQNTRDARSAARRYNAAKRKQNSLSGAGASSLIRLETISETERYSMAQDADRVVEYNNAINAWQNSVAAQLRATIASRSMRIARELHPKAYTDKYGIINQLGFSFPRHGIYIHKGAGRSQGGTIGSNWTKLKTSTELK